MTENINPLSSRAKVRNYEPIFPGERLVDRATRTMSEEGRRRGLVWVEDGPHGLTLQFR